MVSRILFVQTCYVSFTLILLESKNDQYNVEGKRNSFKESLACRSELCLDLFLNTLQGIWSANLLSLQIINLTSTNKS